MKFKIKSRLSGKVIATETGKTLKEAIEKLVKRNANLRNTDLRYADLRYADLRYANLWNANLRNANLRNTDLRNADMRNADLWNADLRNANLRNANLRNTDLWNADLRYADLWNADLRYANLWNANLRNANLRNTDLWNADLRYADLWNADLLFHQFPSIRLISSIQLGNLSDKITLELMRRDAYAHPKPERFKKWAKGGPCPYQNEERFWFFTEKKKLWRTGKPQMIDSDLILAICKDKGWGISGYLKNKK